MANKKITPQMEKSIIDFIDEYPTKREAVEAFNAHWGTDFHYRTLTQRYNNMKKGAEEVMEDDFEEKQLNRIAKAQVRAMYEQKKATIMKNGIHKDLRALAGKDRINELIIEHAGKDIKPFVRVANKEATKAIVDLTIADLQYKGDEQEWVQKIFSKFIPIVEWLNKSDARIEFRFTFLGDDVEAAHAHESQLAANKEDTISQTLEVAKLYTQGIRELSNYIDTNKHSISLVFTPFSNHGMIGGIGKQRYQRPMEDVGRIIFRWIEEATKDLDINIYQPDYDRYLIDTGDTVYLHGHQGYAKNKARFQEVVGVKSDVFMAHLHHFEMRDEMHRTVFQMPTCRKDLQDYERMAGFAPTPQVVVVIREDGVASIRKINL